MTAKNRFPTAEVATLADVAALARVSPATASRAFNQPELLNPETRERVRAAAVELRYLPDGLARSLRSNRSKVIGAVMPALRHAYFASTVEGLQLAIAKQGYTLVLATSEFDLTACRLFFCGCSVGGGMNLKPLTLHPYTIPTGLSCS